MAVIGEFTTNGNAITGQVRTLTVSMKARLNPIERTSRDAPDFRITAGAQTLAARFAGRSASKSRITRAESRYRSLA